MAKKTFIPLEVQREIEEAIKHRYPEVAARANIFLSELKQEGTRITGKATFWAGANDSDLNFEYDRFRRNGGDPLYIVHDWND